MKKIDLVDIGNQYPSIESYKKHTDDTIRLEGIYNKKNIIYFKIKPIGTVNIDSITTLPGISFRFILAITNGTNMATNAKLYTSVGYKKDIIESVTENNPYFVRDALKLPYIVHYALPNTVKLVTNFVQGKTGTGTPDLDSDGKQKSAVEFVSISKYNFIERNGTIDYEKLVRYIDWVTSPPIILSEIDTNNVLPIGKVLADSDYTKQPYSVPVIPTIINTTLIKLSPSNYGNGGNTSAAAFGGFDGNANPINTNEYKPVEDYNPTYNPNAPNSTVGGATGGSTAGAGATGTNNGPGGGTGTPGNGTTPNTQGTPQSAGTNPTGGNIIPDVGIGPKGYQL